MPPTASGQHSARLPRRSCASAGRAGGTMIAGRVTAVAAAIVFAAGGLFAASGLVSDGPVRTRDDGETAALASDPGSDAPWDAVGAAVAAAFDTGDAALGAEVRVGVVIPRRPPSHLGSFQQHAERHPNKPPRRSASPPPVQSSYLKFEISDLRFEI